MGLKTFLARPIQSTFSVLICFSLVFRAFPTFWYNSPSFDDSLEAQALADWLSAISAETQKDISVADKLILESTDTWLNTEPSKEELLNTVSIFSDVPIPSSNSGYELHDEKTFSGAGLRSRKQGTNSFASKHTTHSVAPTLPESLTLSNNRPDEVDSYLLPSSSERTVQNYQGIISLSYGQTVTGTITTPGQVVTYTFSASAGDIILAGVSDSSIFDPEVRLYAPNGSLLTSNSSYGNYVEITRTLTAAGNHTLLVSDNGGTDTADYSLSLLGPSISGISPNTGGNTGFVTVQIDGWGFQSGAEVKLVRTGKPYIIGIDTMAPDFGRIITRFDLRGQEAGTWDVVVTQPGEQLSLPSAFTIETGQEPDLWIDIVGRDPVRVGPEETIRIQVGNNGNVDTYDVLLFVTVPISTQVDIDAPRPEIPGVNWEDVPLGTETDSEKIIPIWLYRVGANSSNEVKIKVKLSVDDWQGGEPFEIKAAVKQETSTFSSSGNSDDIEESPTFLALRDSLWDSMRQVSDSEGIPLDDSDLVEAEQKLKDAALTSIAMALFAAPIALILIQAGGGWALVGGALAIALLVKGGIGLFNLLTDLYKTFADRYYSTVTGRSWDPNDKAGPIGTGGSGHNVPPGQTLEYVIYFENVITATAAAEDVVIIDQLDTNLDWNTLQFVGTSHTATITTDSTSRTITWTFTDINLPPNVNPPEGEGWGAFTIVPNENLPLGTQIRNKASIVFDFNPPIETPEWVNTIGIDKGNSVYLPLILRNSP